MTSEEIEKDQGGPVAKLAAALGEIHAAAGNQPKALDDSGVAWFVERGAIDLFSAKCTDGRMQSAFKHLARLTAAFAELPAPPAAVCSAASPGPLPTGVETSAIDILIAMLRGHMGREAA